MVCFLSPAKEHQPTTYSTTGECPSDHAQDITILNAEARFLPTLKGLNERFPTLKIVLEHCTTAAAVAAVKECGPTVVGTITVRYLSLSIEIVVKATDEL
jgi:dihydroorotase